MAACVATLCGAAGELGQVLVGCVLYIKRHSLIISQMMPGGFVIFIDFRKVFCVMLLYNRGVCTAPGSSRLCSRRHALGCPLLRCVFHPLSLSCRMHSLGAVSKQSDSLNVRFAH